MAFVARKPFVYKGRHYRPGEVVEGYPETFLRAESFVRTGIIIEVADEAPKPKKAAPKPKKAVEEPVEEIVVEEPVETVEE